MNLITYHRLGMGPELSVKHKTLFYYARDPGPATALVAEELKAQRSAQTRDASAFNELDAEACQRVVIMPDVPPHYRQKIQHAYGQLVQDSDVPIVPQKQLIVGVERRDTASTSTDLRTLTRRELAQMAEGKGLTVHSTAKRDDIMAAIRSHGH